MEGPLRGAIRQIGYVVADFDQTLQRWIDLGIGPWYVIRGMAHRANYRGEPCEVTLSIAFANSGEVQLEVIHQEDDTPSIYTEYLSPRRDPINQLAWWVVDFEDAVAGV
jgi:hypothetical protein